MAKPGKKIVLFFHYNSRTMYYSKKFFRQKRSYIQFSTKKVSRLFSLECIQRVWTCRQTQNCRRSCQNELYPCATPSNRQQVWRVFSSPINILPTRCPVLWRIGDALECICRLHWSGDIYTSAHVCCETFCDFLMLIHPCPCPLVLWLN